MGLTAILEALGAMFAPIFREIIPVLYEIWRQPEDAKHITTTPEQQAVTEKVNDEWNKMLQEYDVPADYSDAY